MPKLSKKEATLAIILGIIVLAFLMERVVFQPFLSRLKDITTRIDVSERRLQKATYIDFRRDDILKSFKHQKPYIELGKTEEDALAVIMKKIEEIANECEIILINMKPQTAKKERSEPGYEYKKIQLSIDGSQAGILKFLYKVENSKYPLSINNLDFKVKDREEGVMEASLDIYFIYFV